MENDRQHSPDVSSEGTEKAGAGLEYEDYILCYNVGGCSTPANSFRAACSAVLEAFKAARDLGKTPGAIALQEYPWSDTLMKDLKSTLERVSGVIWEAERQWIDRPEADALVLYDTTKYDCKKIKASSILISEDALYAQTKYNRSSLDSLSQDGRWAGVQLTVKDPKTTAVLPRQLHLVSFHGPRDSNQTTTKNTRGGPNHFVPVKKAVAREFIGQVAVVGAKPALEPENAADQGGVPSLIVGDWNIDAASFPTLNDVRENKVVDIVYRHECMVPAGIARTSRTGSTASTVDYAVCINYIKSSKLTFGCAIKVLEALPLKQRAFFDHAPLLIKFSLGPWQPCTIPDASQLYQDNGNDRSVPESTAGAPATPNLMRATLAAHTRSRASYDIERAYSSYSSEEQKVSGVI